MFLAVIAMRALVPNAFEKAVGAQARQNLQAPVFQFDSTWPKQLPNKWVVGHVIGVSVDARDHIWVLHRPGSLSDFQKAAALNPPIAECCVPAPPVLEFDQVGNLVSSWGGKGAGYEWPRSEHGIFVDHKDNVWVGGGGAILKFTRAGKFLLQIGRQGMTKGNNDTQNLSGNADINVDPANNEVYVADGYGNRRVIVFDGDTGAFKRMWGAYGHKPQDPDLSKPADTRLTPDERKFKVVEHYNPDGPPSQHYSTVHGVALAKDGLVYVCDRGNSRVQVFKKDGTFVKEVIIAKKTLFPGTAWGAAFSPDPQQRFLYVVDGINRKVWILLRDSLQIVGKFGEGGHGGGQIDMVHNIAVDSKGSIYVTESLEGKRVQRFLHKGMGPASLSQ